MKRKTKNVLIGGCITLSLAVVILVTFIIGQNTGQKAVLAEAFVDKVSDQVTGQMDDDVTGQPQHYSRRKPKTSRPVENLGEW